MALKPTAIQAALMEEAIEEKLHEGDLEKGEQDMLQDACIDLRCYRRGR